MEFLEKLQKATLIIDQLALQSPDYNLWKSITAQLQFIEIDFDFTGNFKKQATIEEVKSIIIGVQSVREIEAGNLELADLLCEIDYEYKKLYNCIRTHL